MYKIYLYLLFFLFLKFVHINFIFADNVCTGILSICPSQKWVKIIHHDIFTLQSLQCMYNLFVNFIFCLLKYVYY